MCTHRNPIHCIIPPYLTDKLLDMLGETDETQEKADNRFREKRKNIAEIPASTLESLASRPVVDKTKLHREVYDSLETPAAEGKLIWEEGDPMPKKDPELKRAILGAGAVWTFYKKCFDRFSIDNAGLAIIQNLRYREKKKKPYFNAFWDGEQMFYGSGAKKITNSFTSDLDIIGHELTHGVIDSECKLEYRFQSGALNESFADVFGIMIKQHAKKLTSRKSDWLIGKNILIGTNALRSMKAPGSAFKNDPGFGDDPQPGHMKDFQHMQNNEDGDNGGVHINSGIPNHAFYITCFELAGHAWEKAGAVWYAAMTDHDAMKPRSKFVDAAKATLDKAALLFGKGSKVVKAVEKGWKETGVI